MNLLKTKFTPYIIHKTIGENESKYESAYGVYGILIYYIIYYITRQQKPGHRNPATRTRLAIYNAWAGLA